MFRAIVLSVGAVAVCGCASMSRALSYGSDFADARFEAAGKSFAVWVHPTESTVMIQGDTGSAVSAGLVEGLTFGAGGVDPAYRTWAAGAAAFVSPIGCEARDLRPLDQDIMWEFDFVCPEGVDLRALAAAQRDGLRRGERLHR